MRRYTRATPMWNCPSFRCPRNWCDEDLSDDETIGRCYSISFTRPRFARSDYASVSDAAASRLSPVPSALNSIWSVFGDYSFNPLHSSNNQFSSDLDEQPQNDTRPEFLDQLDSGLIAGLPLRSDYGSSAIPFPFPFPFLGNPQSDPLDSGSFTFEPSTSFTPGDADDIVTPNESIVVSAQPVSCLPSDRLAVPQHSDGGSRTSSISNYEILDPETLDEGPQPGPPLPPRAFENEKRNTRFIHSLARHRTRSERESLLSETSSSSLPAPVKVTPTGGRTERSVSMPPSPSNAPVVRQKNVRSDESDYAEIDRSAGRKEVDAITLFNRRASGGPVYAEAGPGRKSRSLPREQVGSRLN